MIVAGISGLIISLAGMKITQYKEMKASNHLGAIGYVASYTTFFLLGFVSLGVTVAGIFML